MSQKVYTVFAGVNGAGKSTLYDTKRYNPNEIRINPDEIVQGFGDWRNTKDQMEATKIAVRRVRECLDAGKSFNQETTLAGKSILRTIQQAKERGYEVHLNYVGLASADLAKERVRQRVLKGGHI